MKIIKLGFALMLVLLISMCFVCCNNSDNSSDECKHKNIIDSEVSVTCDSEGYKLHTCADCGASYKTDRVAPAGHKLEKSVTSPTCEEIGYTTYTCECGFTYKSDFVVPQGHSYTEVVTQPTCTTEGYTNYTCKCGDTYTSNHVIPKAHTYVSTIVEPTCTENGYTENICECGDSYLSDFVSPTGHTYTDEVFPPTCEIGGYTVYTCECGDTYSSDRVAPLGHTFEQNITPATCTEEGYTDYICECGSSYRSDFVEPLGHTFDEKIKYPTISSMGYSVFTCSCGYSYTGDYVFYQNTVITPNEGDSSSIFSRGIDVSVHQHQNIDGIYQPLDWAAIKAEGVEFAILRASYGSSVCPVFEMNYTDAKAAGMPIGAYCYTTATTVEGIKAEAIALLEILDGKQFEYPIYLDLEDPSQQELGAELLMEMCITFCETLQKQGYYVALYINNAWLKDILDTEFIYNNLDIWYARYTDSNDFIWGETEDKIWTDTYAPSVGMWQYTCTGVLSSIHDIYVDFNYCYTDYPTIIKNLGLNGYGEQPPVDDIVYLWITANVLNVRSTPDFTADNVIGYLTYGTCVEAVEITDDYVKILYNGTEAYIGTRYISYTEVSSEM